MHRLVLLALQNVRMRHDRVGHRLAQDRIHLLLAARRDPARRHHDPLEQNIEHQDRHRQADQYFLPIALSKEHEDQKREQNNINTLIFDKRDRHSAQRQPAVSRRILRVVINSVHQAAEHRKRCCEHSIQDNVGIEGREHRVQAHEQEHQVPVKRPQNPAKIVQHPRQSPRIEGADRDRQRKTSPVDMPGSLSCLEKQPEQDRHYNRMVSGNITPRILDRRQVPYQRIHSHGLLVGVLDSSRLNPRIFGAGKDHPDRKHHQEQFKLPVLFKEHIETAGFEPPALPGCNRS